jgi:hypothetical protein
VKLTDRNGRESRPAPGRLARTRDNNRRKTKEKMSGAAERLGADSDLLAAIGSWHETLNERSSAVELESVERRRGGRQDVTR